jgi:hypothetical protein
MLGSSVNNTFEVLSIKKLQKTVHNKAFPIQFTGIPFAAG